MAFYVGNIATTVLEAINKIGSLANGPILAVFALGLLSKRVHGTGAVCALLLGIAFNVYCWLMLPNISWLWWNVGGFVIACGVGVLSSLLYKPASQEYYAEHLNPDTLEKRVKNYLTTESNVNWRLRGIYLVAWFFCLLSVLWILQG